MQATTRLQNFPISFFAMIMGLSGLTIAYFKLTGELDAFARILYFSGLFLTLLLVLKAVVGLLLVRTAVAVRKHVICVPE